jgi:hypothetical protein
MRVLENELIKKKKFTDDFLGLKPKLFNRKIFIYQTNIRE